jgi:hypothetical protein
VDSRVEPVSAALARRGLALLRLSGDNGAVATRKEHPILHGLAALVGVGVAIGLIVGLAVLLATQGLGLGDPDPVASDTAAGAQSMFLPKPTETDLSTGPLVTLAPGETEAPETSAAAPTGMTLVAGQAEVAPMQQIDLTGTYAGGEGAVLQVQRFEGGSWRDFPVTASVGNGTFSTYIQTSQPGPNRFRMADTDSGATSNEVVVRIG